MRKRFFKFSLIGLIMLGLVSGAAAQTKKRSGKAIEPTAKESIKQILSNGDIPLSLASNCKSAGTSPEDKTILDYLSGILSFQTAKDSSNRIEFTFKRENGRASEIIWVCDLMIFGKDAEDVWSNGVRFKMRNSDRKLLRNTVMCIGTG